MDLVWFVHELRYADSRWSLWTCLAVYLAKVFPRWTIRPAKLVEGKGLQRFDAKVVKRTTIRRL